MEKLEKAQNKLQDAAAEAVNAQLETTITQVLAEQLSAQVLAIVGDDTIHELSRKLINANLEYIRENPKRIIGLGDYDLNRDRYSYNYSSTEDDFMRRNPVLTAVRNELRAELSDKIVEAFHDVVNEKATAEFFHQEAEQIYEDYIKSFHDIMVSSMVKNTIKGVNGDTSSLAESALNIAGESSRLASQAYSEARNR